MKVKLAYRPAKRGTDEGKGSKKDLHFYSPEKNNLRREKTPRRYRGEN